MKEYIIVIILILIFFMFLEMADYIPSNWKKETEKENDNNDNNENENEEKFTNGQQSQQSQQSQQERQLRYEAELKRIRAQSQQLVSNALDYQVQTIPQSQSDLQGIECPTLANDKTIYKPIPQGVKDTTKHSFIKNDPYQILRNYRNPKNITSGYLESKTIDIDYYQIQDIVHSLVDNKQYFTFHNNLYQLDQLEFVDQTNIKNDRYLEYILQKIKYHLILKINIETKNKNYDDPKYQHSLFKVINTELIKAFYNSELEYYKMVLVLEIYRKNKNNSNVIYFEIGYKPDKELLLVYNAEVIGIRNQDQIAFNELYNDSIGQGKNSHFRKFLNSNRISDSENTVIPTYSKLIWDKRQLDKKIETDNQRYRCFHPSIDTQLYTDAKDRNTCETYHEELEGCGIWDRSCTEDKECPFFQANKNYPNNRGGCIKEIGSEEGHCELPVNMSRIGFRHYGKEKPICYNCQKDENRECVGFNCNQCCDQQTNKDKYPNLVTPDFAFTNDKNDRIKHQEHLESKELGILDLL